jgi:hypothetical protein
MGPRLTSSTMQYTCMVLDHGEILSAALQILYIRVLQYSQVVDAVHMLLSHHRGDLLRQVLA